MRKIAFIALVSLVSSASFAATFCGDDEKCSKKKVDPIANIGVDYNWLTPTCSIYNSAGVSDIRGLSVDVGLAKINLNKNFNLMFKLGVNIGNYRHDNLIPSSTAIGYDVNELRSDYFKGVVLGFQPHELIEIAIPVYFSIRHNRYKDSYSVVDPNTIIDGELSGILSDMNNGRRTFGTSFNPGLRSGLELTFMPNKLISVYSRLNWGVYGKREVYDIAGVQQNFVTLEKNFPIEEVKSTAEWGVAVGVRLNLFIPG